MRIPVTDAFDDADQLESLEVKLSPKQIEWLKQTAADRDLSLDHMLRTILTAKMREEEASASLPPESGDSIPQSPNAAPTPSSTEPEEDTADDDPPSIVESLRSASERLQDLTDEEDEATPSDPADTLARLRSRADNASTTDDDSTENGPETVLMDDTPSRSMFDMMEE